MKDEYNSEYYENTYKLAEKAVSGSNSFPGNAVAEEVNSFAGNAAGEEFGSESKTAAKKACGKNVAGTVSNIVKSFFAVAVVAAVTVTSAVTTNNVSAEFVSLAATDAAVSYTVNVKGDTDAELVVFNDFTRREVALENGENTGEVSGLKPNMKYTVAVVYQSAVGERTVIQDSVYTEKYAVAEPLSAFYSISHECTCNIDGYFHFTVDFTDENGYWSDFTASLEDEYGNTSYCAFTDDIREEQSIDVVIKAGLKGNTATFLFSFKTDSPEHVPDTDLLTYYEQTQTLIYRVTVKI